MIYSIGYANRELPEMIRLLKSLGVKSLVDVRSSPFSSMYSQFNQDIIDGQLAAAQINYYSMGHQLGPRVLDPELYHENGQVNFTEVAKSRRFSAGLDRLRELSKSNPVAIMCAEKDPSVCHRSLLVGQAAFAKGAEVAHILFDGAIETHSQLLDGLCEQYGLVEDLFSEKSDLWPLAYEKQVEKYAYRRPSKNNEKTSVGYA